MMNVTCDSSPVVGVTMVAESEAMATADVADDTQFGADHHQPPPWFLEKHVQNR